MTEIVPSQFAVINSKWIVIHNTTPDKIKFKAANGKEFDVFSNSKSFKKYDINEKLEISNLRGEIITRCIGFVIHICIVTEDTKNRIWDNEFYLGCGGINQIFRKQLGEEVVLINSPTNKLVDYTLTNTSIIDMMELHYMYNNPTLKADLDKSQRIPYKIHFIWLKKDEKSEFSEGYFDSWYRHHTSNTFCPFTFYIWTDFDVHIDKPNVVVKCQKDIDKL